MNFSKKNHGHKNNNKNVVSKKVRLTTTIMGMVIIGLITMSCKEAKKENPQDNTLRSETDNPEQVNTKANFNDVETEAIFQHYIHIKTALVNSDIAEAQSGARMLIENTDNVALKSTASSIADTDDIEIQRKAFSEVTAQIEPLLKKSLSSGEIYKQFCPMAFNNAGGYWLSNDKLIQNPYYGQKMLKCGTITETIEKL
ncbi:MULTISPECIES: DUF3347 domain-containing protein [unclassified Arenibacter]|jgi:hypothetical protein|uniref:DUF3347 domain-containing protein n=1 Tax=unclassified Arenibacter TaxID=2615047 RepID=UPI000E3471DD|nr:MULTISPECIES: DUF3347 domain-containing protein [unclassified Arenibacter]MCM4162227.1 hypothetical protein [Arenibacter sp. A80]RFT57834.1 DUF3347 domain-containing protein [Arenibacter sp. P308M17]